MSLWGDTMSSNLINSNFNLLNFLRTVNLQIYKSRRNDGIMAINLLFLRREIRINKFRCHSKYDEVAHLPNEPVAFRQKRLSQDLLFCHCAPKGPHE